MPKFKFSYDKENDDLLLFNSQSKSKGSVELGDLVLDFNSKKEFVGIQIANASHFFNEITGENISVLKELFKNLNKCKVETKLQNNLLLIKIFLFGKEKEITPVITMPNIMESSPALAQT